MLERVAGSSGLPASALPAPAAAAAAAAAVISEEGASGLPLGWKAKVTKSSAQQFFYNTATKETCWTLEEVLQRFTVLAAAAGGGAHSSTALETSAPTAAPVAAPAAAPAAAEAAAPLQQSAQGGLPPGWRQRVSKSSGKVFYYNVETKATAWTVEEIP